MSRIFMFCHQITRLIVLDAFLKRSACAHGQQGTRLSGKATHAQLAGNAMQVAGTWARASLVRARACFMGARAPCPSRTFASRSSVLSTSRASRSPRASTLSMFSVMIAFTSSTFEGARRACEGQVAWRGARVAARSSAQLAAGATGSGAAVQARAPTFFCTEATREKSSGCCEARTMSSRSFLLRGKRREPGTPAQHTSLASATP
jgi:hypothetical protein